MRIKNTENHFGIVAIGLHWLMAILIIGLLALGLYMVALPISFEKLKLYGWHKECGILAFMLVIIRSIWRVSNLLPELNISWWEKLAARSMHYAFYLVMFVMPITGWVITSAAGLPASFFGLFVLPNIVSPDPNLMHLFEKIHQYLGYALIAMIGMHVSAALKHHFIDKDDILKRILY